MNKITNNAGNYRYLLGPVPSGRPGISLGIDLVPPKTCNCNRIYCECGRTTSLTAKRREHVPTAEVIEEPDEIIFGLSELIEEFSGEIWLEIFFVPGLNDTEEELAALSEAVHRITPDRVQLNNLDRSGVVDWIRAATPEEMERFAAGLGYEGTEITGRPSSGSGIGSFSGDAVEQLMQTIRRRLCTAGDLSSVPGLQKLQKNELSKYIQLLTEEGKVREKGIAVEYFSEFLKRTEI